MLVLSGLGNVLGCDPNDLVCLEFACGSGMAVNPDANSRPVAPCVPTCGAGQTLNTDTLSCEPNATSNAAASNASLVNLLTPIDATPSTDSSLIPGWSTSLLNPATWGKGSTSTFPWKWILGGLAVVGLGALAWHHHTHTTHAPAAAAS
jgi:hypothetical protein